MATNKATEAAGDAESQAVCCKYLRMGPVHFIKKYLWTAQHLSQSGAVELQGEHPKDSSLTHALLTKYRRVLAFLIPAAFFHFMWWGYMIYHNQFHLFAQNYNGDKSANATDSGSHKNYEMSITMLFGSIIAGMTSVGGGAVAFPVMTLAFQVKPFIARDFVLMIQSCGMTAAAFSILFMRVKLDWYSLISCSVGAIAGIIFGFEVVDPVLSPPAKKMAFVSIWFSYGSVLAILNLQRKRKTYDVVQDVNWWKIVVLLLTGFAGGIFTSVAGSGVDICSFSVMTLLFRISERIATPTSVIMMGFNSVIGFYWRGLVVQEITDDAFAFWAVCIPVVVFGAPIGSVLGSHMHRLVLAALVIILVTISLISAFVLVPQTPTLAGASVGIIFGGVLFYAVLAFLGHLIHKEDDAKLAHQVRDEENGKVAGAANPAFDFDKLEQSYM